MTLPLPTGQTIRPWQAEYLAAVTAGYRRGYRRMLCDACTGAGKGSVIAGMAALSAQKGHRVLVVVGRTVLVHDLADRIRALGVDVGVVQGPHKDTGSQVVVACIASLRKPRLDACGRFAVLIEDEAHHVGAASYQRVRKRLVELCHGLLILGYTATPFTSKPDGRIVPLDRHFDATVYTYGLPQAIADGAVVPPRGIRVDTGVDLSGVDITAGGELDPEQVSKLVDVPGRNALVAQMHLQHSQGRPGLAFCVDIAHAEHVAEAMRDAGINATAVHSGMSKKRSAGVLDAARAGEVAVLCSADMILEGFDWPAAYIGHRLRPTMSQIVVRQMMGRLVRRHPGKNHCYWLDYIDRGLPLELADTADLICNEAEKRKATRQKPWQVGDCVVHRYHSALGAGLVIEADEHMVRVNWGPKHGEKPHSHGELAEAPIDAPDIPLPAVSVEWLGDRALHILPRQAPESAMGWIRYQGDWSCSARTRQGTTITAIARQSSGGIVRMWLVERLDKDTATAEKLDDGRHLLPLQRAVEDRLRAMGARPDMSAPWRSTDITEGQQRALQRLGVPGITDQTTRGEATALLDHIGAQRAVENRLRELRRKHAGGRYGR